MDIERAEAPSSWWGRLVGWGRSSVVLGMVFRYSCHSIMLMLALLNEPRAAPRLPDTILDLYAPSAFVLQYNYLIWLVFYVPVALLLWHRAREIFVRFLWVGGLMSLLRGLTIPLTGLGPVNGEDVNVGLGANRLLDAWLELINPLSSLFGDSAHVYMTKDLFFSGHTASTFLLFLYCAKAERQLGKLALVCHLAVVLTVFVSHLHYTIDVVGAWAITFSVFVLVEGWGRPNGEG